MNECGDPAFGAEGRTTWTHHGKLCVAFHQSDGVFLHALKVPRQSMHERRMHSCERSVDNSFSSANLHAFSRNDTIAQLLVRGRDELLACTIVRRSKES